MPNSLTEIGKECFKRCESLEQINIPQKVTIIGEDSFERCTSLKKINIPKSVGRIEDGAFYHCEALETVNISKYFSKLTKIDRDAFCGCFSLKKFEFPNRLQIIGSDAFRGTSIRNVVIPECVWDIGNGAFCYCHELTSADILADKLNIDDDAFYGCENLQKVRFNEKIKHVNMDIFENDEKLNEIWIGADTTWKSEKLAKVVDLEKIIKRYKNNSEEDSPKRTVDLEPEEDRC